MIADLLYCELARLALYHLLIPHYVDCCIRNIPMVDCYIRCHYIFHIFQYLRWLLCIILQSFVTASVLSSHTSSSHMLIVDLLFWYLHLNYKPIFHTHPSCKIAKLQLQNVSSLHPLQCPHHNSILVVVAFTYKYTTDSAAPPDHYREAEVGAAPAIFVIVPSIYLNNVYVYALLR